MSQYISRVPMNIKKMCEAVREYADRRFPEYDAMSLGITLPRVWSILLSNADSRIS